MNNLVHGGFFTACCDQNSLDELLDALKCAPDKTDMETWNISAPMWSASIHAAIQSKLAEND